METEKTPLEEAVLQTVRAEMAAQGLTQAQLAERVGVGREAMNRYVKGRTAVPFPVLIEISQALGLDLGGLIDRAELRLE